MDLPWRSGATTVLTWLVRDARVDRLDEEEDWDEEEERSVVMVRCVGEQKEYDSE